MFVFIVLIAVQIFWGVTLLVKAATEEPSSVNISRIQRGLALFMFAMAAWLTLVYCSI